jgi:hypothetical protein
MPEEPRYVGYLAGPPTHEIDRAHKTTPPRPGVRVGGTEPIEMAQELGKPLSKFERGRMAIQRRTTDERFSQRFGLEGADADDLLAHTASSFGSLSSNHLFATHATRDHLAETWARKHGPGEAYGRAGQSAYDVDEATGGHGRSDGLDTTGERDSIRQPRHTGAWDEVGVLGPLTTPEVRRVVAWRAASLRRCGPLGDARVHFTIDGLGVVRDVTTTAATRREARAAECVAGLVRRMWFPRGLGSVRITYPIPPSSPHHLSPAMQVVPADAPHTAP